ncbi:MAG TPA: hypothetical protein VN544_03500 [Gaiellaceae bacterium]|jgi:hypothetical protein|nr:hypothetical protein [Gaiellaceae bacterium]
MFVPPPVALFVRPAAALAALEGCIRDEPDWRGPLYVAPIVTAMRHR